MHMDTYAKLLSVMESLVIHHRELADLEQDKVRLIIDQDWEHLEATVEKSKDVLRSIEDAERQRVGLIETIDERWKDNPPSVSTLIEHVPSPFRADIQQAAETLRTTVVELKSLNKRSEQLIAGSLEVVDFTLSLLSGVSSKGRTYSGDGEEKVEGGEHPSLVFDVKA